MPSNWYSHVFMDPSDIEKFFSNDQTILEVYGNISEEIQEDSIGHLEDIKRVLPRIPPKEADFIELYFFHKIKQAAIAGLFGVSQPTVCYRLQRAKKRIRYLIELPEYDQEDLEKFLHMILKDHTDIEIMKRMLETTCQSEVARSLNASQGFVRHRFYRSLKHIKSYPGERSRLYQRIFTYMSQNLNVLKSEDKLEKTEPIGYVLG